LIEKDDDRFTKKYSARKSPLSVWNYFSEQAFASSL